jgi:hypothetical protein
MSLGLTDHLTEAQSQFAREHDATPMVRSSHSRSIFMYRANDRRMHRWLVDALGRTVDSASFEL